MSSTRPDVKVVRGNGRVIYLPPIEAPTTRAKRRAQNFPVSSTTVSDVSTISVSESLLECSQLTNSSAESESFLGNIPGVSKKQMPRDSSTGIRRPRRSNKLDVSVVDDADASESQEDDDDPNK